MARPIKIGLDYFPMDTTWDIKMRLLKARYKLEGIGLIVELYQAIYREGYALAWNEDSRLLIADEVGISIERLDEIVAFAASKDIFNSATLKKGYLTSHGIQARWVKACTDTKRKENKIPTEIDLLQHNDEFTPEETPINSEETRSYQEFSTQIKGNKIKGNKKEITPEFSQDFLTFYDSYPRKEGKKAASKTFTAKVKQGATPDQIMASLAVYKSQIERNHTETKFVKLPATFLNCYDEYKPAPQPARPPRLGLKAGLTCPICGNPLITGDTGCRKCYAGQYRGIPDEMFEVIQ
jgi:hypothetical protein